MLILIAEHLLAYLMYILFFHRAYWQAKYELWCLELTASLYGQLPAWRLRRYIVGADAIALHLYDQIVVVLKGEMVIKTFLVIMVAALYLSVMPRDTGANPFMGYS